MVRLVVYFGASASTDEAITSDSDLGIGVDSEESLRRTETCGGGDGPWRRRIECSLSQCTISLLLASSTAHSSASQTRKLKDKIRREHAPTGRYRSWRYEA